MAKWERQRHTWKPESRHERDCVREARARGTERGRGFPKFLPIQVIWNPWIWAFETQDGFGPNPNPNGFKLSKQKIWIWALKSKSLGPNPPHPNISQRLVDPAHGIYQTVFQEPFHASQPFAIECIKWLPIRVPEWLLQDPWNWRWKGSGMLKRLLSGQRN